MDSLKVKRLLRHFFCRRGDEFCGKLLNAGSVAQRVTMDEYETFSKDGVRGRHSVNGKRSCTNFIRACLVENINVLRTFV